MADKVNAAVGRVLREVRLEQSFTSTRLAAESGLSYRFLMYLEAGEKSLSVRTLFRLCEALGVAPSTIIHRVERELERK